MIVSIIEASKTIMNAFGLSAANRALHMFALSSKGMPQAHEISADNVIVSVGYEPNQQLFSQVKNDHVHLIGDAESPTNVMDAIWAAYEIAKDI